MNINMTTLAEQLSRDFTVVGVSIADSSRFLNRVMLFSEAQTPADNTVYVAEAEALPEKPPLSRGNAVICIGPPPESYADGFNCVALTADAPLAEVMNRLQSIFYTFMNWCNALHYTLYQEKGIQAIVNEALPMFENPIYIHDRNYRLIAYAENRSLPGMEFRYDFLSSGRLSPETVRELTEAPEFAATFRTTEPTYWKKRENVEEFSYLYCNLHVNGKYYGRVFIDERVRPISATDHVVLHELVSVLELALRLRNYFDGKHTSHIDVQLSKLLEGAVVPDETIAEVLSDLGWDAGGPFLAMKVAIPGEDVVFNTKLVICDALESAYPGCHTFFYNNDILAVATGCAASAQKQRFFQIAAGVAQDFHISIGVSQLFDELSALRSYCEQSDVALRLGMELEPLKSIHCFDSHTLTYILRQCTTRFSANMLAPPSLSRLMAYDRKYNTEFAKTLRVYMECDCSTAQAAARLFIHRSTLLYRLDRIKELFGLDLSDNDEKLHMLLAFKLLDGQQASG